MHAAMCLKGIFSQVDSLPHSWHSVDSDMLMLVCKKNLCREWRGTDNTLILSLSGDKDYIIVEPEYTLK